VYATFVALSEVEEMMTIENLNPESAIVSIIKANNYDLAELIPALKKSLEMIGGLNVIVKSGNKVFIKINHLSPPSPAERGIVTHQIFVEAVLLLLKEMGVEIIVGDDIEEGDGDGFKISGFREMCNRLGVKLVNLRETGFVEKECNGRVLKNVYISRLVLEADVIINLPKFKTHSLTTFTGGIKNMYGVIPAGLRRRFHGDYLRTEDFCQMLVDIFSVAKPQLTIMDGIIAMEGEGPGSGQLRKLGLILTSKDSVALDAVSSRIIRLKPDEVLTTRFAVERGLGIGDLKKIEIVGEKLDSLVVSDFKLPANFSRLAVNRAPHGLVKFVIGQISPRPRVKKKNCTACNECVKVCPTGAATMVGKIAVINDKLCIRCMCCHEVCRFNAIVPRRPFIGNVVYSIVSGVRKSMKM
jgi:uncharacterized protein (DUF362 family)/Pyruvate/2-oxoacid:ferredoxin oxidoreductase delta subunit